MGNITIVVDSVACLPKKYIAELDITIVPLNLHFDGSLYRDGVDIDAAKAYELLEQAPDLFASSPASPEEYAEVFRKAAKQGHDIICFTMSIELSTMHNMASVAREIVAAEFPGITIKVIDSLTATASEGLLAIQTARFAEQSNSINESIQFAHEAREKVGVVFIMDTLKYVYRTGRIPKAASKVGSLLPIKPILTVTGGKAHITAVSRTTPNGIRRIIDIVKQRIGDSSIIVAIQHAQIPDEGKALMKTVESELNCSEIFLTDFSPVMGYATGKGALGIAYYCL